jgi:hypothetical protein
MKRIFIMLASVLLTVQVFALGDNKTFKEVSDSWLKSSNDGYSGNDDGLTGDNGLTGGNGSDDNPNITSTPVGDAIPLLLLLSGIYGIFFLKKQKEAK